MFAVSLPLFAFQQSDIFGRIIVVILVVMSVLSWTIILEKYFSLRDIQKNTFVKLQSLTFSYTLYDIFSGLDSSQGPLINILEKCIEQILIFTPFSRSQFISHLRSSQNTPFLSAHDIEIIQSTCEEAVEKEILHLEKHLDILSSIVSASPFIGLLGTVWGVMMAFSGMAMKGKADINIIAPGISGALLTTVAALLVAIPALIGYNYLVDQIKRQEMVLYNASEKIIHLLKRYYPASGSESIDEKTSDT